MGRLPSTERQFPTCGRRAPESAATADGGEAKGNELERSAASVGLAGRRLDDKRRCCVVLRKARQQRWRWFGPHGVRVESWARRDGVVERRVDLRISVRGRKVTATGAGAHSLLLGTLVTTALALLAFVREHPSVVTIDSTDGAKSFGTTFAADASWIVMVDHIGRGRRGPSTILRFGRIDGGRLIETEHN